MSKKFTAAERKLIQKRSKYRCEYCLLLEKYMDCVNEHIIASSLGGTDKLENIANACRRCNAHKYNKIEGYDEQTDQISRFFNPRIDKWNDHFRWDDEYILILGLTAIGRVTANSLKMNHPKSRDLRLLMRLGKEHPPEDLI